MDRVEVLDCRKITYIGLPPLPLYFAILNEALSTFTWHHTDPSCSSEPADTPGSRMASAAYASQRHINDNYDVVGFISSGTYGRVYKARSKSGRNAPPVINQLTGKTIEAFAIKKFVSPFL